MRVRSACCWVVTSCSMACGSGAYVEAPADEVQEATPPSGKDAGDALEDGAIEPTDAADDDTGGLVVMDGGSLSADGSALLTEEDAGLPPEEYDVPPDVMVPSGMGPYPVGVVTLVLEDHLRPSADFSPRKLVVEVWYPATDAALGQPGHIYPASDVISPAGMALLGDRFPSGTTIPSGAVRDAAPRRGQGPFPMVLFSHGAGGYRIQSTFLTVALASHGYVVVSPDHGGDTMSDYVLSGGVNVLAVARSFVDRPLDMKFLAQRFGHINVDTDHVLQGMTDVTQIALVGHSHGAITALRSAAMIPNVKVVVTHGTPEYLLTWLAMPQRMEDLGMPVMLVTGTRDMQTTVAHSDTIWEHLTPSRARVTLRDAGHFTFSDACTMDPEALAFAPDIFGIDVMGDSCSPLHVTPNHAFPIIRHFTIGFIERTIRPSPEVSALLTQAQSDALVPGQATLLLDD